MISIKLKDRFVEYDFELYDKYTLIQGDSADGKTSLYELISTYYQSPDAIQCSGHKNLRNLPFTRDKNEIELVLLGNSNYVFIMDENHPLLLMEGFEKLLNDSDNYFTAKYAKFISEIKAKSKEILLKHKDLANILFEELNKKSVLTHTEIEDIINKNK